MDWMLNHSSFLIIRKVRECDFFSNVGGFIEGDYIILDSWLEAERVCCSEEIKNKVFEACNRLRGEIPWEVFNKTWNDINSSVVTEVKPIFENRMQGMLRIRDESLTDPDALLWHCGRIIVHSIMENEYDEYGVDDFFRTCLKILLQGHLVCGYEGEYPHGKLIVF